VVKIFVPYLLQLWEEIKNIRELNTLLKLSKKLETSSNIMRTRCARISVYF